MPVPSAITAYGATIAPDNAPPSPPANVIDTLYTVALGPTGGSHYAPLFARFGTLGRTSTAWNSAAAAFTVAWLVYRRLWGAALAYVVVMEGIAIAWFLGVRPWLQLPLPVEAGLVLAWLTLGIVGPGLWGDALVYNDVHKRTMRSLESASTLSQARQELEREAPTRRRLYALAALQSLVIAALLVALLPFGTPTAPPPIVPTEATPPPPAPLPTADEVLARMATTTPSAPASETPETVEPAVPEGAAVVAPTTPESPLPESPPEATANGMATTGAPHPAATPATPAPQPHAPPANAPAPRSSMAPKAAATGTSEAATSIRQTLEAKRYYVNVGVFADESNAQKVQQQLQHAKLPLVVQTVGTNKGDRIRVRAGPFTSADKARAAANRARALGLEAVVFQHQ